MKKFLLALSMAVAFVANAFSADSGEAQAAKFNEVSHDFGTFIETVGSVSHVFEFTNNTSGPIVLTDVKTSCGCTTPTWTKTPVSPGQKGSVTVTYDAKNRPGAFAKTITVSSNTGVTRLQIKGEVILEKDKNRIHDDDD